jgi:hypothetical protein
MPTPRTKFYVGLPGDFAEQRMEIVGGVVELATELALTMLEWCFSKMTR